MIDTKLALIVAVARNGTIGKGGDLPWRLPADLKWFKQKTMGHHVVMGRRTFESLGGHPLPGRTKVVLTSDRGLSVPDSVVVHDLPSAIAVAADAGDDEVFVIGGAGVYVEALPMADRVYLTRIHADVQGDVALAAFARGASGGQEWVEVWREDHPADDRHAHAFSWCILERSA